MASIAARMLAKQLAGAAMASAAKGQVGAARRLAVTKAKAMANRCAVNPNACKGQLLGAAGFVGNMGSALRPQMQQQQMPQQYQQMAKGGVVRKGGRYYLHKGEKVVAKRSVPKVTKAMQKDGMRVRHKGAAAVKKVPFVPLSKLRNMGNGGAVLKTGLHVLKAGQRVIPASKVPRARKAIKKSSN